MRNHWRFTDLPGGACEVDFYVEFEFSSRLLAKLIGLLFHEAVRRMVGAFERRAAELYGTNRPALAAG
jgi:coenzyme Q-binding protein COQ10